MVDEQLELAVPTELRLTACDVTQVGIPRLPVVNRLPELIFGRIEAPVEVA